MRLVIQQTFNHRVLFVYSGVFMYSFRVLYLGHSCYLHSCRLHYFAREDFPPDCLWKFSWFLPLFARIVSLCQLSYNGSYNISIIVAYFRFNISAFLVMWFADHRICRRGTEKPCYKITSFQDSRLRASFEAARQKCREDDGELLSIETENEQRLVERFVQELRASDGDFWIGLRRSPRYNAECSSQYYWLDYSQATFR